MKIRDSVFIAGFGIASAIGSFFTTNVLCNKSCQVCSGLDFFNPFCQAGYTACVAGLGACGLAASILGFILFYGGIILVLLGLFQFITGVLFGTK
jgi:hypothetical protein